jgi:2-polyprenyl-3-methyl-5-hydroxy-6-metoxy-1,4-benzoquinol methylase
MIVPAPTSPQTKIVDILYKKYSERKKWHDCGSILSKNEAFAIEIQRANINRNASILDIGFGEGEFLEWANLRGYSVEGIEINETYVNRMRDKGLVAHLDDPVHFLKHANKKWDLIWIFDVLEHLSLDEIYALLSEVSFKLYSNGKILIRIPNGISPFGRFHQYGDPTHVTSLSPPIIGDIAEVVGLQIKQALNSARPLRTSKRQYLLKKLEHCLRDLIELFIGYLYFGGRIPLDPNLTLILEKN